MLRFSLTLSLSLLLFSACQTTESSQKTEPTNAPVEREESDGPPVDGPLAAAIPDRALFVAKMPMTDLVDGLGGMATGVKPEQVKKRRRGLAGAVVEATMRGEMPRARSLFRSADRPEVGGRVEHLDLQKPAYLTLAEPASPRIRHLLDYGGVLGSFRGVESGIRARLLLPSSDPAALADDLRGTEEARLTAIRTVEGYAVVDLSFDPTPDDRGEPPALETSTSLPVRFGLQRATPALQAFAAHDGTAWYGTFEGVRRLGAIIGLQTAKAALAQANRGDRARFTLQGSVQALWPLVTDAADRADYADAALVSRPADEPESQGHLDLVLSPTRRGRRAADEEVARWPVPVPEVDEPLLTATWSAPAVGKRGSLPMMSGEEPPRKVIEAVRHGGVWTYVTMAAGLMEDPGGWFDALSTLLVRPAVDRRLSEEQLAKIDASIFPEVVSAEVGWADEGDSVLSRLTGGVAVGWPSGQAPRWLTEALPLPKSRHRWVEAERRDFLLVGLGAGVEAAFPEPTRLQERGPSVSFNIEPMLSMLDDDERRQAEAALDQLAGTRRMHLTMATGEGARVLRLTQGGESAVAPPDALLDRTGGVPDPESWAWRRCRGESIARSIRAVETLQVVVPGNRAKVISAARKDITEASRACSDRFPEREGDFRRAVATWSDWVGAMAHGNLDLHAAKEAWSKACDAGVEGACQKRDEIGDLSDWAGLPMGDRKALRVTAVGGDEETVGFFRIDRSGSVHLFPAGEGGTSTDAEDVSEALDGWRGQFGESDKLEFVAVPDALLPVADIEPLVRAARERGATGDFRLAISYSPDFQTDSFFGAVAYTAFWAAPDSDSDRSRPDPEEAQVVVRLTRRGVDVSVDGEEIASPERCPADGPTFCLAGERETIDGLETALRAALEEETGDPDAAHRDLLDAYPLHEIHSALHERFGEEWGGLVRLDVASDVPVTVLPQLLAAVFYEREEAEPADLEAYRDTDVASEIRGRYKRPARLFESFIVEIVDPRPDVRE